MLTVINKDNTFSGVQYPEIKQEYINHHKQYGQKLIWCERILSYNEDGQVIETPTEKELANEITEGEDISNISYMLDLDFRLSMVELGI
jgi:hypothetical protein